MKAHAGHVIASALLRTYLGEQTGRRVHAGAIERGSVESLPGEASLVGVKPRMSANHSGSTSQSSVRLITRIEALCEPLRKTILVSAEFAAALDNSDDRLVSLGYHRLRGVREAKEIFAPAPSATS
jgi:hypothetical protein